MAPIFMARISKRLGGMARSRQGHVFTTLTVLLAASACGSWAAVGYDGSPVKEQASQQRPAKLTKKGQRDIRRPGAGVTAEQAAAVNTLVRKHHPELASLLDHLKESRPSQYTQAVRTLFRTSVRLASIQERDMERYDLELKRWKLESQSQLLALRAVHNEKDQKLKAELKAISQELLKTRVALMELERDRQEARLQRLNEQLDGLLRNPEQRVDANVKSLLRSAAVLVKAEKKPKQATAGSEKPSSSKKKRGENVRADRNRKAKDAD